MSESRNDLRKEDGNGGVRIADCQTDYSAGRLGFH